MIVIYNQPDKNCQCKLLAAAPSREILIMGLMEGGEVLMVNSGSDDQLSVTLTFVE